MRFHSVKGEALIQLTHIQIRVERPVFLVWIAIIFCVFDEESLIFRVKNFLSPISIKVSYRFAFFSRTILTIKNQIGALVVSALSLHGNIFFFHGEYVVLMFLGARLSCSERKRQFFDT